MEQAADHKKKRNRRQRPQKEAETAAAQHKNKHQQSSTMQTVLVTRAAFMGLGLELVGYTKANMERRSERTNIDAFRHHFGVIPQTCEDMWVDIVANNESPIKSKKDPVFFLLALRLLWTYDTGENLSPIFHMSKKTISRHAFKWVDKICLLLDNKVCTMRK
jgi:hypothetical protein